MLIIYTIYDKCHTYVKYGERYILSLKIRIELWPYPVSKTTLL